MFVCACAGTAPKRKRVLKEADVGLDKEDYDLIRENLGGGGDAEEDEEEEGVCLR